ncbi:INO80 complex subunit E isoform X3 [Takifugu rubripes]|uniref:INO80 complex subunit E isoform X3 n=1 Tax=Takifugu rubripes TaxID=31033 RepID=UPI001145A0D9|nr:INO80 complex subunit E isoform X3 [Takifugu rubripes]
MSQRPTQTRDMNGQADAEIDYKRKYKNLKRKLKFLVYEQECFQEELRRAQRKLLKISRDKSFLLDRLLPYERVDEDSSDSDATVSSENSEGEILGEREREAAKKRRSSPGASLPSPASPHISLMSRQGVNSLHSPGAAPYLNTVSAPVASNYASAAVGASAARNPFSWVPRQMLSGDAAEEEGDSDGDSDRGDEDRGEGDEAELVIDIPNE